MKFSYNIRGLIKAAAQEDSKSSATDSIPTTMDSKGTAPVAITPERQAQIESDRANDNLTHLREDMENNPQNYDQPDPSRSGYYQGKLDEAYQKGYTAQDAPAINGGARTQLTGGADPNIQMPDTGVDQTVQPMGSPRDGVNYSGEHGWLVDSARENPGGFWDQVYAGVEGEKGPLDNPMKGYQPGPTPQIQTQDPQQPVNMTPSPAPEQAPASNANDPANYTDVNLDTNQPAFYDGSQQPQEQQPAGPLDNQITGTGEHDVPQPSVNVDTDVEPIKRPKYLGNFNRDVEPGGFADQVYEFTDGPKGPLDNPLKKYTPNMSGTKIDAGIPEQLPAQAHRAYNDKIIKQSSNMIGLLQLLK